MMNEKELPTTFTDESLNVDASETSKDQEPPEPNKPSVADSLEEAFFEDNLKPKIEPVSYDGVNVSESHTDENEKDTEHADKSLNAFSGEDEPGTPNDEVRSKPNTLENKADSLETTSFEDNSETKDKLQKFEVILERKVDADENEMDTSHDSNNMNGFSNDPSEKSKDDVTVDQYSKIKRKHAKHGDVLQETVHSKGIPKDRDNKQVIFKSIKDEEMSELVGNKHKQKWAVKDMMEHSQSENKHIKDDDIFLETIKIDHDLENNLKEVPGALDYIRKLHHLIHKHIKKIRKLRRKLCEQTSKQYKDSFTQTVVEPQQTKAEPGATEKENKIEVESKPKSLAEDIAEAAQMAVQNSGFVYEETSGMYYDYNTGYYYNAEYGLYYDGSTGTYMSYNQDTQSYEFHSQVSVSPNQQTEKKPDRRKRKNKGNTSKERSKRQRKENKDDSGQEDIEEGECSDSSESYSASDDESSEHESDSSEISKAAPCMRVIVEASEVPSLKIGSLFIITRDGGSLGREGRHSIIIGDLNVSKHHLKFTFDDRDGCYHVTDLGSRNGTLLNGKRLSPSKQESELSTVQHGSKIQIGSTILLCHIHDGTQTCGHCEPGLLQEQNDDQEAPRVVIRYNRAERHKNELKSLKKLCGIKSYNPDSKLADGYTDRAQRRRDTVGSQNPHEKTQVASVDESISKENKGFKLLQKMGWKEGESLGKENEGIVEPIKVIANQGTTGIGAEASVPPATKEKSAIWVKTQERFNKLPDTKDILGLDSD